MVHEGTHARLERAGFPFRGNNRHRIERICINSELLVARRFLDSEELQAWVETHLAGATPDQYTNLAFHQRAVDGLRRAGAPEWIIQFIERRGPQSAA